MPPPGDRVTSGGFTPTNTLNSTLLDPASRALKNRFAIFDALPRLAVPGRLSGLR